MSALSVSVLGAEVEPYAAVPTLAVRLALGESEGGPVDAVVLRAQVRIEPQRRRYGPEEEERLVELFGPTRQWGESLRPFLWTEVCTVVPRFAGATEVTLPVTCTYDLNVAGTKYLHGLDDGEIPLLFLFSGTVFRSGRSGLQVEPVPWHTEARWRLPMGRWREAMDRYFPGSGWLLLPRETIDALARFKASRAIPTWEQAVEMLLESAGAVSPR